MTRRSRVASAGLAAVAVVVGGQTLLHLANVATVQTDQFDVNAERNVFAFVAALTIYTAGLGCALLAVQGRHPRAALPLSLLLGFLAVDEFFVLHERAGVRAAALLGLSEDWDSVVWPALYLPLLAAVAALLVALARRAPAAPRRLVHAGLACLVGAVLLEVVSFRYSTPTTASGLVHALEGAVEEALELSGWGLLAVALLSWAVPTDPEAPDGGDVSRTGPTAAPGAGR